MLTDQTLSEEKGTENVPDKIRIPQWGSINTTDHSTKKCMPPVDLWYLSLIWGAWRQQIKSIRCTEKSVDSKMPYHSWRACCNWESTADGEDRLLQGQAEMIFKVNPLDPGRTLCKSFHFLGLVSSSVSGCRGICLIRLRRAFCCWRLH